MYFLVFSPKQVFCPGDSPACSFMIKWWSYLDPLWKTIGICSGMLYFKLHMLCAAPLYVRG